MPRFSESSALEDGLDDTSVDANTADDLVDDEEDDGVNLTDADWRRMFKGALDSSTEFYDSKYRAQWGRNYRAYNNRHMPNSKYDTPKYRHRTKIFKPKTRMAVRKNDATAAAALFSTEEVVKITPELTSDRRQVLTARFIHEALNYRLDRADNMTGPNWFMTAVGSRQDAQITGVTISKQYWQYEVREIKHVVERQALDENGIPLFDEFDQIVMEEAIETTYEPVIDRLMVDLVPGELALIDPTGDWRNPIQDGGHFIAAFPTRREEVEQMLTMNAARPKKGGVAWRTDIDMKVLDQAQNDQRNTAGVRQARDQGVDRYESRHADKSLDVVWLYEVFYRYAGTDWTWWMLGEHIMLSDPVPVEEAYPEQKSERPYVIGFGALEAHKPLPMAPVETWQPMQQELNDFTNLRLDAMKMSISPITKIRRGRNVDWKQVQNRGPDATIMVEDPEDVIFDRSPSPPSSTQLDINNLNNDFDELAGIFSQSSVQTNRSLNETVGGMQIMAGASNAVTEFDLRVWVETWVEPTLRQCCRLIQYYESSETVIAVAGEKAGILLQSDESDESALDTRSDRDRMAEQIPISEIIQNLEKVAVSVRVDVGIGAMDSRQKLEKFSVALQKTIEAAPLLKQQGVTPDGKAIMNEIWGLCGYKDASRFFTKDQSEDGPPPEIALEMQKLKQKMAETEKELELEREKLAQEADEADRDREHKLMIKMLELGKEYRALDDKAQEVGRRAVLENRKIESQDRKDENDRRVALKTASLTEREEDGELMTEEDSAREMVVQMTERFQEENQRRDQMLMDSMNSMAQTAQAMMGMMQQIAEQTRQSIEMSRQAFDAASAPRSAELIMDEKGMPVGSVSRIVKENER